MLQFPTCFRLVFIDKVPIILCSQFLHPERKELTRLTIQSMECSHHCLSGFSAQ